MELNETAATASKTDSSDHDASGPSARPSSKRYSTPDLRSERWGGENCGKIEKRWMRRPPAAAAGGINPRRGNAWSGSCWDVITSGWRHSALTWSWSHGLAIRADRPCNTPQGYHTCMRVWLQWVYQLNAQYIILANSVMHFAHQYLFLLICTSYFMSLISDAPLQSEHRCIFTFIDLSDLLQLSFNS